MYFSRETSKAHTIPTTLSGHFQNFLCQRLAMRRVVFFVVVVFLRAVLLPL